MAKKKTRDVFNIVIFKEDFKKLKKFLDIDDAPVYLTFLSEINYKNHKNNKAVIVKTAIEKVEG